jgi:nitrate reductase beta subunit
LYDADKVLDAAATKDVQDLHEAQLGVFLDPHDAAVARAAAEAGIPHDWIEAARRSPVYELAVRHRVALPLHPEYRTLPMVWYIPPLSPVSDVVHAAGYDPDQPDAVFATIDSLRIPIEYLANLFTAGDVAPIRRVLRKLAAVRAIQRAGQLGLDLDEDLPASVGASADELDDLFRLLAVAKYEDRYVIPAVHAEEAGRLMGQHEQLFCSLDTEGGPGMGGDGPGGHTSGQHGGAGPTAGGHGIRSYRPTGEAGAANTFETDDGRTRFNLLGWNGNGPAPGLFPREGDG